MEWKLFYVDTAHPNPDTNEGTMTHDCYENEELALAAACDMLRQIHKTVDRIEGPGKKMDRVAIEALCNARRESGH